MTHSDELQGKIVLITGATHGIGQVTAQSLARMGAQVVVCGRNPQKIQATLSAIRAETSDAQVEGLSADLSSQEQVRLLAQEFRGRFDRLDILVNNAGALFMQREESVDGIEMTLALNHLNYFLLTHLLLDLLKASGAARIVNVSSEAHRFARLKIEDLENKQHYTAWSAYGQSKLANLYFTYALAARLVGSQVTVNALHPGFVATNFGRSNGGLFSPLFKIFQIGAISPEEGAQTSLYLASSPQVEGVTGQYFAKCKAVRSSAISYDASIARRLWDRSLEMCGLPAAP